MSSDPILEEIKGIREDLKKLKSLLLGEGIKNTLPSAKEVPKQGD